MKLIHLSDLHLGKRVNDFPMIDDQRYILADIIKIIDDEIPDCVIIAGDVYDKSMPPVEAVELFDNFLVKLAARNIQVYIISGNHDSAERMAFGARLMDASGIHVSRAYRGNIDSYKIEDEYGEVNIFLLPFIKPINVKIPYPDMEINSYTDALNIAVKNMNVDKTKRNILVAHQFVTGAERTDSEDISVGGSDNVDASVFDDFDYVALGHIHRSQKCGKEHIRYSGTPLKYSFSEANDQKSLTVVEIRQKGNVEISSVPLTPRREMAEIKGRYNDLMDKNYYEGSTLNEDFLRVILTDEDEIMEAMNKMRVVYKNIMKLEYDNQRTRQSAQSVDSSDAETKTPIENFNDLFTMQNGKPLTEEQMSYLNEKIEKIWED